MPGLGFTAALAAAAIAGATTNKVQDPQPTDVAPPQNQGQTAFNPKIGMVVDSRAVLSAEEEEDEEATINEVELSFAADVDPFLKAFAFIAVANEDGETEVEVEEVFGQYDNLGKSLSGRFGKVAAAVGRTNRNHADALSYLDYPLVIQSHFGDEGLRGVGGSLSYLLPTSRFMEFTLDLLVPEDGPIFAESRTSDPVAIGHFRTFFDYTEDLSAQLGATLATGPTIDGDATVFGIDYTMKWQPGAAGKSWMLETEAFWADGAFSGAPDTHGWFVAFTTQLSPKLFLTGKYDFTEVPGTSDEVEAWSATATLKVTEFHHWRLAFEHFNPSFESESDRVTLQFQWAIGPHPSHKY